MGLLTAAAELLIEEVFSETVPIPPPPPRVSPPPSPASALSLPLPPPAHRAVCRLTMVNNAEPSSAPNPERTKSPSVDSGYDPRCEQPPDIAHIAHQPVHSIQGNRVHETVLEKVSDCLRRVKAANKAYNKAPSALSSESRLTAARNSAATRNVISTMLIRTTQTKTRETQRVRGPLRAALLLLSGGIILQ